MSNPPISSIEAHFESLPDPRRVDCRTPHKLLDIVVITICAVICGADNWVAIEAFGNAKYEWLVKFLELPKGIRSHDTFRRVFSAINAAKFEACFINWIRSAVEITQGQVIAVDGKQLRRSYDTHNNKSAIHLVSAWACHQGVALGQLKVADKSNEIPAIPQLLEVLDVSGCIVTIDAMGCQTDIAQTIDGNHGRIETRSAYAIADPGVISTFRASENFVNLNSIVKVTAVREVNHKVTTQSRYYISSLPGDAEQLLEATRHHWRIENSCHWVLDVAFREDASRIRKDNSTENFAIIRRMALNLLKAEKSTKLGVANKRLKAAWDNNYLTTILQTLF